MRAINRSTILYTLLLAIGCFLVACNDDEPGPQEESEGNETEDESYSDGVFVINEGNFEWGEGTVSFIDPRNNKIERNIFEKANDRVLGNVAQSMEIFDDKGFLVVNNSQKIEVVDPGSFESEHIIEGFNSPRYFKGLNMEKGYVSDLYEGAVYVLDLDEMEIADQINVDGWTEDMVIVDDKLFVAGMESASIYEISTSSDAVTNEIDVLAEPASLIEGPDDHLWALSTGGFEETYPGMAKINPDSGEIVSKFEFEDKELSPSDLTYAQSREKFFYRKQGAVFSFETFEDLPGDVFLDPDGDFGIYNMQYLPSLNQLWVADAKDFTREGDVFAYDPADASLIEQWEGGIIPGHFTFYGE